MLASTLAVLATLGAASAGAIPKQVHIGQPTTLECEGKPICVTKSSNTGTRVTSSTECSSGSGNSKWIFQETKSSSSNGPYYIIKLDDGSNQCLCTDGE